MDAQTVALRIVDSSISTLDFKYCLVTAEKIPIRYDGKNASPDKLEDFVPLYEIVDSNLASYAGLGISIQASNISAIDVDHCFKVPFDVESVDERGKQIIDLFKDVAYIEFSFSGTGLRVLFYSDKIENYTDTYYIKNSKNEMEFYHPTFKARYVTITGCSIINNEPKNCDISLLNTFLTNYMVRPKKLKNEEISVSNEERSLDELKQIVKHHYLTNHHFQDLWFKNAPGSNSDESETDYAIISYIYENITKDKELIKALFETSWFFKTKDWKHKNKWTFNNHRYYEYIYAHL